MCDCNNYTCKCQIVKEEPAKFQPKVGEVYQTENKVHRFTITAIGLKGTSGFTTGATFHQYPEYDILIRLADTGTYQGMKLIPFKGPKIVTLYIVMGNSGSSSIVPFKPTHPKAFLAYKKVTLTEGEYDD